MKTNYQIVVLGLSLTSSWGNGHATTYRALLREFAKRGHSVLFLERDVPWYASNRDLPHPAFCQCELYKDLPDLRARFTQALREADFVLVGSYVPEGVAVGQWAIQTASCPIAFYDIDTPVTLAKLQRNDTEYINQDLLARYDLYLSFSGGPTLDRLEQLGSPMARPLYCSVDPLHYHPQELEPRWDLGYLGTYSPDRQPGLDNLLVDPARTLPRQRFIVAGPQYPPDFLWPANVQRIEHLPPSQHATFYNQQRFTLNLTRQDMASAGWSPSVRLFEAAACSTPIISDYWDGLEEFFLPDREILIARRSEDVRAYLNDLSSQEAAAIGHRARARVLNRHTAAHRASELEDYINEVSRAGSPPRHAVV